MANGHALMVDHPTVESVAEAFGRVLRDDALRNELQRRARARGAAIRWYDTSKQTLDVVRQVAASKHRFDGAIA